MRNIPSAGLTDCLRLSRRDRAPPSSKPGDRHMDSDKAEQHDNHVQRDDGHEQDDENPKIVLNRSASGMRGRSMARRIVDFDTPVAFVAVPSDVYISFPRGSTQRGGTCHRHG